MYYFDGKLINDDNISLSVYSPSLLYGASIFTTLRVYHQNLDHPLTQWQEHQLRLKNSIIDFEWVEPDWQQIRREAENLSALHPVLRIAIFPDGKELILTRELPPQLQLKQQKGIKGKVLIENQYQRPLPLHKTGNYLIPYLALEKVKKLGFGEGILTDNHNNWLETTTGNLWGYRDNCWFTPSLPQGLLPGIARKFILDNANFTVAENIWHEDFIQGLRALGYSNSVVEFIPFQLIEFSGKLINFDVNHHSINLIKNLFSNQN
ncbi:MAG: aminotransferase class IV [Cyanobacterium sp. T60_A2020_053]|nr:aminotransferase class IV [Cyanobacterium sp. T60_A2020_053]